MRLLVKGQAPVPVCPDDMAAEERHPWRPTDLAAGKTVTVFLIDDATSTPNASGRRGAAAAGAMLRACASSSPWGADTGEDRHFAPQPAWSWAPGHDLERAVQLGQLP